MTILQVGSSLNEWGGIERYVAYLQQGLISKGHRVEVTAPPNAPLAHHATNVRLLSTRGKHDLRALAAYLRLIRQQRYDIVHLHFNPDFLVAGVAARIAKQPCTVLTRHVALPWSKAKVRMYGAIADHFIPVSNAVQEQLQASGIPPHRMTVAKAGAPEPVRITPFLVGEGFHVGSFGRLTREKGIDILTAAARELSSVNFHVFGKGPEEAALKSLAPDNVRFHGFIENVADAMAAMDVVVIPSRWAEAFPYAALEAMAVGKALVVSQMGGLLELVDEPETGRSFPNEQVPALVEVLEDLRHKPSRGEAMGLAGQKRFRSEFTISRMADRIEAVYFQVAKQV